MRGPIIRGLMVVYLAVLGACTEAPDSAPLLPATQTETSLKLYVFDCGHLTFQTVDRFSVQDHETDVRELVVPCYVIEHPEGRMLWDGGLPSSFTTPPSHRPNAKIDTPLAEQLRVLDLGFDLVSLDYVAFSHMHYDHVGVANEVIGATWLVQKPEHEAMFGDMDLPSPAEPDLYNNLLDADTILLNGDYDVFGDGRVKILSAPGHTPGHQILFVDLKETGPLVLSGDLYHFRVSREHRRVPTFNFDVDVTLASMEKIESFVTEIGATFWIEHDYELFQELKKAPMYYE